MKGIILSGGHGTRLHPLTLSVSKQLLPVYNKPMIYYPLALLMICGIREILLITTSKDQIHFKNILGDGKHLGIEISYTIQDKPEGIAQAYLLAEDFLNNESSVLILGDNLFHGNFKCFKEAVRRKDIKAQIFAYQVAHPQRYGVVEFDRSGKVAGIEEKPKEPRSNFVIPGIYIMDSSAVERVKRLAPSKRGELEITDLINTYLVENQLHVEPIGRGMAWMDMGTPQTLLEAGNYINAIENRQGVKVACLEEIALRNGFISASSFKKLIEKMPGCSYRDYLESICQKGL